MTASNPIPCADDLAHAPTRRDVATARCMLLACGVPSEELERIDVTVGVPGARGGQTGVSYHVQTGLLACGPFISLGEGVFVAGLELTFLQAVSWMSRWELIEFGYEICGSYELCLPSGSDYRSAPPRSSCEGLGNFLDSAAGAHGVKAARRALWFVRGGARSPMETALMLLLVLPKREGGMGFRCIEMDHPLDLPASVYHLTRRRRFYFDIFIASCLLDIEYDGATHREGVQVAIDHERDNVLSKLGYQVCRVSSAQMKSSRGLRRALSSIAERCGFTLSSSTDYVRMQEELRRFVMRNADGA